MYIANKYNKDGGCELTRESERKREVAGFINITIINCQCGTRTMQVEIKMIFVICI